MDGGSPILLVEDDADLAASLQVVFEQAGYSVMTAVSGPEAVEASRRGPALVLLDYYLPGEPTGRLLVDAIRSYLAPGTKILLLSAARDVRSVTEETGADGYLEKPFDIDLLLRTIERALVGQAPLHPAP